MKEEIEQKILQLERQKAELQVTHDTAVREDQQRQMVFQQKVADNRNKFQQITGAIAALTELLAAQQEENT